MRHDPDDLIAAAGSLLDKAKHRSGPIRTIAILKSQACIAAAQLKADDHVSEHCPDVLPWIKCFGWEEI